jgi:hypothetical protein
VQDCVLIHIRCTQCCFIGPKLVRPFLLLLHLPFMSWINEWEYHQDTSPTILAISWPHSDILHSHYLITLHLYQFVENFKRGKNPLRTKSELRYENFLRPMFCALCHYTPILPPEHYLSKWFLRSPLHVTPEMCTVYRIIKSLFNIKFRAVSLTHWTCLISVLSLIKMFRRLKSGCCFITVECRIRYKYTPPRNGGKRDGSSVRTFTHMHKINQWQT